MSQERRTLEEGIIGIVGRIQMSETSGEQPSLEAEALFAENRILMEQLHEAEASIREYVASKNERDEALAKKEKELEYRSNKLREARTKVREARTKVKALESRNKDAQAKVLNLRDKVVALQEELSEQRSSMDAQIKTAANLDRTNRELHQRLQKTEIRLRTILESRSWKFIRVVRKCRGWLSWPPAHKSPAHKS